MTVTGSMADHRLRLRGSEVGAFAAAVARELAARPGFELLAPLAAAVKLPPSPGVGRALAVGGGARSGKEPGQVPGHRRSPAAGRRARAGERDECRARQRRHHRQLERADPARSGHRAGGALGAHRRDRGRQRSTRWSSPRATRLTRRPPTSSSTSCCRASRTPSITRCTRTRRRRRATRWFRPPTPSSRGATRAASMGPSRSASRSSRPSGAASPRSKCWRRSWARPSWASYQIVRRYWQGQSARFGSGLDFFDNTWEKWLADGVIPDTAVKPEGDVADRRRRAGEAGGAAAGRARPTPRAGWRWRSPPIPRCTTAASPTTPGCRSCRTRSPS